MGAGDGEPERLVQATVFPATPQQTHMKLNILCLLDILLNILCFFWQFYSTNEYLSSATAPLPSPPNASLSLFFFFP